MKVHVNIYALLLFSAHPLKEGNHRINQIHVQKRAGKGDPLTEGAVAVVRKVLKGWKSERYCVVLEVIEAYAHCYYLKGA